MAPELGLEGVLDAVIEKWGVCFPVEYKWSRYPRLHPSHQVQLAAGAMALEEMRGIQVTSGYVYFLPKGPRKLVGISPELRARVVALQAEAEGLLRSGDLPPVVQSARCHACGCAPVCRPQESRRQSQELEGGIGWAWYKQGAPTAAAAGGPQDDLEEGWVLDDSPDEDKQQ